MTSLRRPYEEVRTCYEGYRAGGSIPGRASNIMRQHLQGHWHKWRHSAPTGGAAAAVGAAAGAKAGNGLSIKEMKRVLRTAHVDTSSCIERADVAGGVLRTCPRPSLNTLLLLRASV